MKKLSRTFAAVLISFAFSFCAISFAQQADTPKATTTKKQPPAPSSEKPAENAINPG